jgi:carbamoyltransferase
MLVLGYAGGLDLTYEQRTHLFPSEWFHDSAAVLIDNGKIVAAIEEERLNRIKHTNKAPVSAIRFCLDQYKLRLDEVDQIVVAASENFLIKTMRKIDLQRIAGEPMKSPRELFHDTLQRGLGEDIADSKLHFLPHHVAHALSAYALSGFDTSLVFTADGGGDDIAGLVGTAEGGSFSVLQKTPIHKSLGIFYLDMIGFLGFGLFEEYKVMGLAPYGDAAKYRALFKSFYDLLPNGDYQFKYDLPDGLAEITPVRKRHDPLLQVHKDLAAALQEALEAIVFHVLRHYQRQTRQRRLCLAGGVAHNCTLNGKLLYAKMFDKVFVQPASHDGGLALGAALSPFFQDRQYRTLIASPMESVYLGSEAGDSQSIGATLQKWRSFLEFQQTEQIAQEAANLLAQGKVLGWVQGRSEFGPRALGNRSIVADPRPADNKDLINRMVKKREAYRPFAPAVLEEYATEYFELPEPARRFSFMTFVVKVREEKREVLKATTHVDGTARIQTVTRQSNPAFWELIKAFGELTGVPVLLNTSFNNNVEPIVDSVEDAIVCFLTTKLDHLIVGDYLISKKAVEEDAYVNLRLSLPPYTRLTHERRSVAPGVLADHFQVTNTFHELYNVTVSEAVFGILLKADGKTSIAELGSAMRETLNQNLPADILKTLLELWSLRAVQLFPR